MLKQVVAMGPAGRVVVMDSITKLERDDEGAIIVSASHGGSSSGEFAQAVAVALVVFNDAGSGKEDAGIAALALLQQRSIPAATVSHNSAKIGDSMDAWENGIVSFANDSARRLGLAEGLLLRTLLSHLIGVA